MTKRVSCHRILQSGRASVSYRRRHKVLSLDVLIRPIDSAMTSSITPIITTSASGSADSADYIILPSTLVATYFILAVLTIFGNGLVIISYMIDRSIRDSTANAYIFNLAIADICVGIFDFLGTFTWAVTGGSLDPPFIPCFLSGCLRHIAILFSAVVVAFLSWDRYKLISDALLYIRDQTPKRAMVRCACGWLIVILYVTVLHGFGVILVEPRGRGAGCIHVDVPRIIVVISFFPDFLLPLSIILTLNTSVALALRRRTLNKVKEQLSHQTALPPKPVPLKGHLVDKTDNIPTTSLTCNDSLPSFEIRLSNDSHTKLYGVANDIENDYEHKLTMKSKQIDDSSSEIRIDDHSNMPGDKEHRDVEDVRLHDENKSNNKRETKTQGMGFKNPSNTAVGVRRKETSVVATTNKQAQLRDISSSVVAATTNKQAQLRDVSSSNRRQFDKLRKAVKALTIFTVIYVLCWIPFYVISLLAVIKDDLNMWALYIGAIIVSFNSTINPFLYAAMSMKFRNRFILISKCKFL